MRSTYVKLVVFVPETHAEVVRKALGDAGGGRVGDYAHCTFSSKGIGRFQGLARSNPTVGKRGKLVVVKEERIEVVCLHKDLSRVLKSVKRVHPYEVIAADVYPLLNTGKILGSNESPLRLH